MGLARRLLVCVALCCVASLGVAQAASAPVENKKPTTTTRPKKASRGSGTGSQCGKAIDSYHNALVAGDTDGTGGNLTDKQEFAHQNDVVQHCTMAGFVALINGDNYDYTKGPDAVAGANPRSVYRAFCDGAAKPNFCSDL